MYYVYILWSCKRSKFYIGYTNNLERRLKEHREGKVHTTKRYQDHILIFYEAFTEKEDALRREKYFKTTKGKKTLRLMLHDTLIKYRQG